MKLFITAFFLASLASSCSGQCTQEAWDACWENFTQFENVTSNSWIPIYDNDTLYTLCDAVVEVHNCIYPFVLYCPVSTLATYVQFINGWDHLCSSAEEYLMYVDCFNKSHDADDQCVDDFNSEVVLLIPPYDEICGLFWTLLACVSGNIEAVCNASAAAWVRELDRLYFEVEALFYGVECSLALTTTTTSTTIPTTSVNTSSITSSSSATTTSKGDGITDNQKGSSGISDSSIVGIVVAVTVLLIAILVVVSVLLYLKLKHSSTRAQHTASDASDAPVYYSAQARMATLHGPPGYYPEDPITKVRPPDYECVEAQPNSPPSQPPSQHINPRLQQLLQQQRPGVQTPPSVDT